MSGKRRELVFTVMKCKQLQGKWWDEECSFERQQFDAAADV